jgi:hypothetical protein
MSESDSMEQKTFLQTSSPEPQRIAIDWTDSDWFRIWLRLARHEGHDNAAADQQPSWVARAAA